MELYQFPIKKISLIFIICIISFSVVAQKADPDTLNADQFKQYVKNADKMQKTGIVMTVAGSALAISGLLLAREYTENHPFFWKWDEDFKINSYMILFICGGASAVAGIPLWVIGGRRKTNAVLTLKKYEIVPQNAKALGLEISIRF